MIYPKPSGFSVSGANASNLYLGDKLVWPDVFLFYAPSIPAGASGDGISFGTTVTFRNGAGGYLEKFEDFVNRRLATNDRIMRVPCNPCISKDSYEYNLTFSSVTGDLRSPIRVFLAHPSGMCTITQITDLDAPAGAGDVGSIITVPAPAISGTSGTLLSYNGINYKLYTLNTVPTGQTRNYAVKTYL